MQSGEREHAPAPLATAFFRNTISTSAGPASADAASRRKPSTATARLSRARDAAIPRDGNRILSFFLPWARAKGREKRGRDGSEGVATEKQASTGWLRAASGSFHRVQGRHK